MAAINRFEKAVRGAYADGTRFDNRLRCNIKWRTSVDPTSTRYARRDATPKDEGAPVTRGPDPGGVRKAASGVVTDNTVVDDIGECSAREDGLRGYDGGLNDAAERHTSAARWRAGRRHDNGPAEPEKIKTKEV